MSQALKHALQQEDAVRCYANQPFINSLIIRRKQEVTHVHIYKQAIRELLWNYSRQLPVRRR